MELHSASSAWGMPAAKSVHQYDDHIAHCARASSGKIARLINPHVTAWQSRSMGVSDGSAACAWDSEVVPGTQRVHKNGRVREPIEETGCDVSGQHAYSLDFNPIGQPVPGVQQPLRPSARPSAASSKHFAQEPTATPCRTRAFPHRRFALLDQLMS